MSRSVLGVAASAAVRFICALFVLCLPQSAESQVPPPIGAFGTGTYDETGFSFGSNGNHSVGFVFGGEFHNFFVFDVSALSGSIEAATLILNAGQVSTDGVFQLHDVTTDPSTVASGGTGLIAIYNDLGDGDVFGSLSIDQNQDGVSLSIPLNTLGLADLNSAVGSGMFALGGEYLTCSCPNGFAFGGFPGTVQLVFSSPPAVRAAAFHDAIDFLENASASWPGSDREAVLLGEAVAADASAAGVRSATTLASLELNSLDTRARRASVLIALGLDPTDDIDALLDALQLGRPTGISLIAAERGGSTLPKYGEGGTRLPSAIDEALALQALQAAGVLPAIAPGGEVAIDDALAFLIEFQVDSGAWQGAWPLIHFSSQSQLTPTIGNYNVTAQVLIGMAPYQAYTIQVTTTLPLTLLDPNVGNAYQAGITFLKSNIPQDAAGRALRVIALTGEQPQSVVDIDAAVQDLLELADRDLTGALTGSFDGSEYATALAARALRVASSVPSLEFDTDADGIIDPLDPNSDGDDYCDPESYNPAACSQTAPDLFPFDPNEWADLDGDGIGDNADPDDDGDGVCDPGKTDPTCTGSDAFPVAGHLT